MPLLVPKFPLRSSPKVPTVGDGAVRSLIFHRIDPLAHAVALDGMFAILVPVALSPLILTLAWAQRKAAKLHPIASDPIHRGSILSRAWNFCIAIDIFGLLLLAAGLACILISLTLAGKQPDGWHTPSMIALIVVGFVILGFFGVFESLFSPKPVIAPRFMKNKAIVGASIIGFFDFV